MLTQHSLQSAKRRYPRPSVTVDAAIVSKPEAAGEAPQLLLVQRKNPPCRVCCTSIHPQHALGMCSGAVASSEATAMAWPSCVTHVAQGMWALPGGFVDQNEDLETAAARELQEETSVHPSDATLFQVNSRQGGLFDAAGAYAENSLSSHGESHNARNCITAVGAHGLSSALGAGTACHDSTARCE